jgi:glycosyltransferase involved in cell wall biosynthesis
MKILQINKYHYIKGGSEMVFFNTINLLKEHGHEPIVFCVKDERNIVSEYDQYFVDYPEMSAVGFRQKLKNSFSFFYNRDARKKLEKLIISEKPDIAHIHLLFNGISVSILPVLKKYHIPIVMTMHDYRLICPSYLLLDSDGKICEKCRNGNYFNCIRRNCYKKNRLNSAMLCLDMYFRNIFYPVMKYVDKFIFVSDFIFEKHISFNCKYKMKGIRLYNFINPESTVATNNSSFTEKYFLYYGRLSREKGIHTLIESVKALNIKLKIVGKGDLLNDSNDDIPANVVLLGFKTGSELQSLIRDAYFVIVPSEYYEIFGLTVIEPQLWGTPVIGANIGAIPELITDGENGFLFEAGNVENLRSVIEKANNCSKTEYKELSQQARKRAKQFSDTSQAYNDLMRIYDEFTEQKNDGNYSAMY